MDTKHISNNLSNELVENLGKVAYTLDKAYMARLREDYRVVPFSDYLKVVNSNKGIIDFKTNIRALKVERFVYDSNELTRDGFKNLLGLFSGGSHNIAVIIRRTPQNVEFYYAVKNENALVSKPAKQHITLLKDSLIGNFNGTTVDPIDDVKSILDFEDSNSVSVLSGIPSDKSEDYISQGIERLLNGVVPKEDKDSYTCIILAQPLSIVELRNILNGYESIASALKPFEEKQLQFGKSKTDTTGESKSDSHSTGISHTKNSSHNLGVALSTGVSLGFSVFGSQSVGANASPFGVGVNANTTVGASTSVTSNVSITGNYGYSFGKADTDSINDTATVGTNKSLSIGDSETTTFSHKSYMVADLIEKLEATIKRINESQSTGLWRNAIYVTSENPDISKSAVSFINSIMQGDASFIEPPYIQSWYRFDKGDDFKNILQYVSHLTHPIFENKIDVESKVWATANVTTPELANIFKLPDVSLQSLPVIECTRFGREPHSLDQLNLDVTLGCAYHMHTKEENNLISISKEELTKHTFITGSTGSGKSNTIYKLLSEVCLKEGSKTNFLIIEPSKGEYKNIFCGRDAITVYGTNPYKTEKLLQINPFSFPDDIHVLEHIDRLVEVFNACWPMYAAMPAILKEAIEKSYEVVGWNLRTSKHISVFPNFDTVLEILPEVVNSSAYSADTSSDYKGALVTRVRSLAKGLSGLIFDGDVPSEDLFNQNVIADISRIGSSETKALIMGILVLKLQEFRMSENNTANTSLRHITVLEEAHNLLRRTSDVQTQESSNLQGKSVEMLANAIAEMRTYGEGFIIADQSPGLMDMSVIRNTNTKIILRLPDESDRQLVGKAAGLNDNQIIELSRLKTGVAAITQSGWLEPVLCMVDKFDMEKPLDMPKTYFDWHDPETIAIKEFLNVAFDVEQTKLSLDTVDKIRKWVAKFSTTEKVRMAIELVLAGGTLDGGQQMLLIGGLFGQKLRDIPERVEATKTTQNLLIGGFNFEENDEIIRRINELFLEYYPVNIYTDTTSAVDNVEVCVL
jgi:hypothetical protein